MLTYLLSLATSFLIIALIRYVILKQYQRRVEDEYGDYMLAVLALPRRRTEAEQVDPPAIQKST